MNILEEVFAVCYIEMFAKKCQNLHN